MWTSGTQQARDFVAWPTSCASDGSQPLLPPTTKTSSSGARNRTNCPRTTCTSSRVFVTTVSRETWLCTTTWSNCCQRYSLYLTLWTLNSTCRACKTLHHICTGCSVCPLHYQGLLGWGWARLISILILALQYWHDTVFVLNSHGTKVTRIKERNQNL